MLTETERDWLERHCALLAAWLPDLVVVRMFGSAARGEISPANSPMAPCDERTRAFPEQVEADGVDVWSSR